MGGNLLRFKIKKEKEISLVNNSMKNLIIEENNKLNTKEDNTDANGEYNDSE